MARFDDHRRQALQQLIESHPMDEVRLIESGCDAIESSLHITKNQRWRRPAHVPEHRAKVLLQAKGTNKEADFVAPVGEAQGVIRLNKMLSDLYRRTFAETCVLCDQPADSGHICGTCRRILPWNDSFCDRCGQAMTAGQPPGVICAGCQEKQPPFEMARAPLTYDFPIDAVIKAIKFKRQLWYVPAFADLLLRTLQSEFAEVDALLPVPLHCRRQMTRGFNQALELCRPLRKATGLPILTQAVRIRATSAQTGLNAAERRKNLKDAFAVPATLHSRHPLIVDDVITTGETCSHLAVELLRAGAKSVSVLTVARAHTGVTELKV